MESASTSNIRNVALVGHGGSGKTTLVEALLSRAGAIARSGRVEEGTTVSDTEPEEIKRGMSLSLAVAPFTWTAPDGETYKVNLIDTPGYADFAAGVDAALTVADLAVVVVSAVDGIEVGTEQVWRRCEEADVPRLVFVTKEDKQRADFHQVLDQLRATFGPRLVPLELPIGEEEALHGIADILSDQGFEYDRDGGHHTEPIPADLVDEEHQLHEEVAEEIVSGDDDQLERYLAGELPTAEELERTLRHEVLDRLEYPVLLGSATTGIGIDRLADFICELGPSPAERPASALVTGAPTPIPADPDGQPLAFVFRTAVDQFVGQISLFKVLSGTIKADDRLTNTTTDVEERLHGLFYLRGREHIPTDRVVAGDIAAVAKLSGTPTGSLLASKGLPVRVAPAAQRPTAYALALRPLTQADDDKLSGALQRLCAEDPSLMVERVDETGQTVLRGSGDVHLAVALERLARKFGVNVATDEVLIPFRETVTGRAEAEGKVKKQSGGHGQYAVVQLRVSPRGRGEGSEFVDSVVGGAIPRNYMPAVERGVDEAMAAGGVYGFPVVDVRVECYDGKYHSVDSSDMAFRTAAAQGLRDALQKAKPVVLEPISQLTVTVPDGMQGDVLGDLNSRRGRISGSASLGDGLHEVQALVPTAELGRYVLDLRSMTGGRGRFSVTHSHYDVLPAHLVDRVARAEGNGSGR
jgi:elongation factor G